MARQQRTQCYDHTLEPPLPLNEVGNFIYQDLDHPSLQKLRERERLDDVVADATDDFDRLVKLRNWTATQWDFGTPNPYPPWDALDILDWIRSGKTQGWCGIYAIVFSQTVMSMGNPNVRFVELGSRHNPICHFLTEVWHTGQNKWVILDPVQGSGGTYSRGDELLNALDLHKAFVGDDMTGIQFNPPVEQPTSSRSPHSLEEWAPSYYRFRIIWRNNYLIDPPPFWNINNTFDRYYDAIDWYDPRIEQWEDSTCRLFPTCPPHTQMTQRRCDDVSILYAPARDHAGVA